MPKAKSSIALVCMLILPGACTWIGDIKRQFTDFLEPEVMLVTLDPVPGVLSEQRFQATVRIANPNPDRLQFDGLSMRLRVGDFPIIKGVGNKVPILVPFGEILATVELGSDENLALAPLSDLLQQDAPAFRYAVELRLSLDAPRRRRLTLRHQGSIGDPPQEESVWPDFLDD